MLERVRWKLMIFSGVGAMIVSLTLGGISQVRFGVVVIRALISGVVFALLSQVLAYLAGRFLPELVADSETSSGEDTSAAAENGGSGQNFDYVMPGGEYGQEESPDGAESVTTRLDDDSETGAEEAESVDDDDPVELSSLDEEPVESTPAPQAPRTAPADQGAPPAGNAELRLNVEDSGPVFDNLPDLGDYSAAFSGREGSEEGESGEVASPTRLDAGVSYTPRGGIHTSNDEAVQQFMSQGAEPAELARTISTVLKREKKST